MLTYCCPPQFNLYPRKYDKLNTTPFFIYFIEDGIAGEVISKKLYLLGKDKNSDTNPMFNT